MIAEALGAPFEDTTVWQYAANDRPDFAIEPERGRESVWDCPRPPVLDLDDRRVEVRDGAALIAATSNSIRIPETASPPTSYVPPDDVDWQFLATASDTSTCEWKGAAQYWALRRESARPIAWNYPRPRSAFASIRGVVAFYPGRGAAGISICAESRTSGRAATPSAT